MLQVVSPTNVGNYDLVSASDHGLDSPVSSERTTQVHVEVLQVFESDGCLYVHKEYPQRDRGQTDASLWNTETEKTVSDLQGLHSVLTQAHQVSSASHFTPFACWTLTRSPPGC